MKREGRIHKGVSIGAYSILIAFMLLLLWTVLRYPGNHLIPWQMALGVAAATVLLLAAGAAWNKIYTVTGRRNSLYAVALVLFGVLLYVVSLSRQGNEEYSAGLHLCLSGCPESGEQERTGRHQLFF